MISKVVIVNAIKLVFIEFLDHTFKMIYRKIVFAFLLKHRVLKK